MGVDFGLPHFDAELDELSQLALTAGLRPVAKMTCKRKAPDAALFVGSGKADEIKFMAEQMGAQEVLFDQSLSPAQQRNLERHLGMPVNDRTLLILEILVSALAVMMASCKLSWPAFNTSVPVWFADGLTSSASVVALAPEAVLEKHKLNSTDA